MKDYPIINRSDVGASNSVICTSIPSIKISVPCLYYQKKKPPKNTNIIGCLYMIVYEYSFTCKKKINEILHWFCFTVEKIRTEYLVLLSLNITLSTV